MKPKFSSHLPIFSTKDDYIMNANSSFNRALFSNQQLGLKSSTHQSQSHGDSIVSEDQIILNRRLHRAVLSALIIIISAAFFGLIISIASTLYWQDHSRVLNNNNNNNNSNNNNYNNNASQFIIIPAKYSSDALNKESTDLVSDDKSKENIINSNFEFGHDLVSDDDNGFSLFQIVIRFYNDGDNVTTTANSTEIMSDFITNSTSSTLSSTTLTTASFVSSTADPQQETNNNLIAQDFIINNKIPEIENPDKVDDRVDKVDDKVDDRVDDKVDDRVDDKADKVDDKVDKVNDRVTLLDIIKYLREMLNVPQIKVDYESS